MKNVLKVLGIALLTAAMAFTVSCSSGGTGGGSSSNSGNSGNSGSNGGGSGDMGIEHISFQVYGTDFVHIYFTQFVEVNYDYGANYSTAFNDDFTLTINGSPQSIIGIQENFYKSFSLLFEHTGTYKVDTDYTIKIVYTADTAHPIKWGKEQDNYPNVLGSFTFEATVKSHSSAK